MDINCNYQEDWDNYCFGSIKIETQSQFSYSAVQSKADPERPAILSGFPIFLASYSLKYPFKNDYLENLIVYFKRFKFPKPGHLSLFT